MATYSNENRKTNCTNGLKPLVRNQYFYGKLLTVRDFQNEQSYHIKKQRLINKHIHGEGVVCGLMVEAAEGDNSKVKIKSGIALDCCGREIVVPEDHIVDLAGKNDGVYWITISYNECGKEPVAAATEANSCEEECCFSRVEEGYEIEILGTKPDICQSVDMKNICKTWAFVSKTDKGKNDSLESVNNLHKYELENNSHKLESGLTHNFISDMEIIEPLVKMRNIREEFVKAYQGNCSLTTEEDNRVLLAKITLSDNNSISIDNALINGNSFDKKLIHSNPKLYELLKCTGKEEEETPITIDKISWPHAGSFTNIDLVKIASSGLEITFSGDIECFNTNQCLKKESVPSLFNFFPEVFKMEVLILNNNDLLKQVIVPGKLSMGDNNKIIKFVPNLYRELLVLLKNANAVQFKVTLNGNFIKRKDSNKPIYCGLYNFIVKGHTTALKSLNHTTTTGGKFESWFYVTSKDSEYSDYPKLVAYDNTNKYLKDSAEKLSQGLREKGVPVVLKELSKLTEEDKATYEIIFLRNNNLSEEAVTKLEYVESDINWNESNGDVVIAHGAENESNAVFVIGGKNKLAVENAVNTYINRYNDPQ